MSYQLRKVISLNGETPSQVVAALFNHATDIESLRAGQPARAKSNNHVKPDDSAVIALTEAGSFMVVDTLHGRKMSLVFNPDKTLDVTEYEAKFGSGSAEQALEYIRT
ncbi:hypothetical protein N9Z27_02050 [Alphaproteobacteria bacterium]|nr:hypothetical protein [Alphaproteobacteria bacterium]